MNPRDIYHQLCEAGDLRAAVHALNCEELTAVAGYLSWLKNKGIAAQVWGEVQEALANSETQDGKTQDSRQEVGGVA